MFLEDAEVEDLLYRIKQWMKPGAYLFVREICYHKSGIEHNFVDPSHYRNPDYYDTLFKSLSLKIELNDFIRIFHEIFNAKNQIFWLVKKPLIKVWADGCFDGMHYGHANALRQAKELGDYLVVGIHSDAEIEFNKGPTLMKERERYDAIKACKWVDEVVEAAPYTTQVHVMDQYNIDFCVHGEDISLAADGTDAYALVKAAGRYRTIKRTEGVSTTDLVERILQILRENTSSAEETKPHSPYTRSSPYVATSIKLAQFSNKREITPYDKVVYIDGSYDLFHVGHIEALKKAKELGDYLIVGIYDDYVVKQIKGEKYPIQNLYERILTVLSCKYVDDVVIGAPFFITDELLTLLKVKVVVHGKTPESHLLADKLADPYKIPREKGLVVQIDSNLRLTTSEIVERVDKDRARYLARNKKKESKELKLVEEQKK